MRDYTSEEAISVWSLSVYPPFLFCYKKQILHMLLCLCLAKLMRTFSKATASTATPFVRTVCTVHTEFAIPGGFWGRD